LYGYGAPRWQNYFLMTPSFDINAFVFAVPPGKPLSNYEKLFLPFDETTWLFLGLTFGIGFCAIFTINQMKKFIRDIFYGSRVTAPSLNMLRNFFGIGMVRLPENNFARIILAFFIFFCLVFRTGYQGTNQNFI
jgi:hypothetical protein